MGVSCSLAPRWQAWEWPKAFATSPLLRPRAYLLLRALWALLFLGHFLALVIQRVILEGESWVFFSKVTQWVFLAQVAESLLSLVCAAGGVALLPVRYDEEKEGSQLPDPVSAGVAIFSLAQPLSFLSMVFYWTVEKPIWAIHSEDLPDYLGFFVHCISWLLTLISLFCSRIPFSCQHGGWVLMFGVAYLVFSFMHYCLKIGLPHGCTGYVQPECPIYEVLDWHKPEDVATVSFLTLGVAFPTAIILYSWMVHLRDSCDGKADLREMDDIIRRQMEALQARERELLKAAIEEEEQGCCFCRCR